MWLPTVLVARQLAHVGLRKDFWRLALRGAPPWLRLMAGGFFAYAILSFALFTCGFYEEPKGNELVTLRGFSGHWMAFYSAALVTLYSYAHIDTTPRRCTNQLP